MACRKPGYLFEQIPYMISGGLIGLGLVMIGSFAYFAYWFTRMFHREQRARPIAPSPCSSGSTRLGDLPAANGAGSGSGSSRSSSPTAGGRNGGVQFVATASGTMFHLPTSTGVVVNRPRSAKVRGDEPNMEPCRLCDPLGATTEV